MSNKAESRKRKSDPTEDEATGSASKKTSRNDFLRKCRIFVLQAGIGKARCELFNKQIVNNGGTFESSFDPTVTHLVVDENMEFDRMCRILKLDAVPQGVNIVTSLWLSSCLKEKDYVETAPFKLKVKETKKEEVTEAVGQKKEAPKGTKDETTSEEALKTKAENGEGKDSEAKPKYPKVGEMFRYSAKPKAPAAAAAAVNDEDSDYVPSGDEGDADQAEDEESPPPSSQSMQRKLPVSHCKIG